MKGFTTVESIEITSEVRRMMEGMCLKAYPLHKFSLDCNDNVIMTKDTWADPASFKVHWTELFFLILPVKALPSMSSRGHFYKNYLTTVVCSKTLYPYLQYLNYYL